MIDRRDLKEKVDSFMYVGYALFHQKFAGLEEFFEGVLVPLKHPVLTYLAYLNGKRGCIDIYEESDLKIEMRKGRLDD